MNLSSLTGDIYIFSQPKGKKLMFPKSILTNIMRIGIVTTALLITTSLQLLCASPIKSQPIDEVKINLGLNNETLIEAFQKIEAGTRYHFMYRKDEVKKNPQPQYTFFQDKH